MDEIVTRPRVHRAAIGGICAVIQLPLVRERRALGRSLLQTGAQCQCY